MCERCKELLATGLDLCVRARDMDARDRRAAHVEASTCPEWAGSERFDVHLIRHNARYPDQPISTRSATVRLWEQDQYDKDLAAWERDARRHLTQ